MQADVTLGVIIAALAPPFGAAIIILFCLQSYVSLHIGQYNCIIDTYNRMLHKKEKSVFTYTLSAALSSVLACMFAFYQSGMLRLTTSSMLHAHPITLSTIAISTPINIAGDGVGTKYRLVRLAPELALQALHLCKRKMLIAISSLMFLMPCLYSLAGNHYKKENTR
jgi:hypothetical protein